MIPPRTGKSVAKRIDIRYIARRGPFRRYQIAAVLSALGVAGTWLAIAAFRGDQRLYQAGPVSAGHACFGNECSQCHTEPWQPLVRLLTLDSAVRSVDDKACRHCHDAADHQATQIKADVPQCAACHREHRGLTLTEVADTFCTACHRDLKTVSGRSTRATHVHDFVRSHPEFAALDGRADAAAIRLNHEVHLKPDGIRGEHGRPVTLQCGACHTLDAERRYMRPVTYAEHCRSCHPLTFDATHFGNTAVPHEAPETIRDFLRGRYVELRERASEPTSAQADDVPRRLPGRAMRERDAADATVTQQIADAEFRLFELGSGCKLCHTLEPRNGRLPKVVAPKIRARWLPHSEFNHQTHLEFVSAGRKLTCDDCHAAHTSHDTRDVLLPSIESCRPCHRPRGVASTVCVECHRYHKRRHEASSEPSSGENRDGNAGNSCGFAAHLDRPNEPRAGGIR